MSMNCDNCNQDIIQNKLYKGETLCPDCIEDLKDKIIDLERKIEELQNEVESLSGQNIALNDDIARLQEYEDDE